MTIGNLSFGLLAVLFATGSSWPQAVQSGAPSEGLCTALAKAPHAGAGTLRPTQDPQGRSELLATYNALSVGRKEIPSEWTMSVSKKFGNEQAVTESWSQSSGHLEVKAGANRHFTLTTDANGKRQALATTDTQKFLTPDFGFSFFNPVMPQIDLLSRLKDTSYSIEAPRESVVEGHDVVVIETSCRQPLWAQLPSLQRWYLDRDSHLPVRVDFGVQSIANQRIVGRARVIYSGFSADGGAMHATSLQETISGLHLSLSLTSFQVRQWAPSSLNSGGAQ